MLIGKDFFKATFTPADRAQLKEAFDAIVFRISRYVTLGVALIYLVIFLPTDFLSDPLVRTVMVPLDVATVMFLVAIYAAIELGHIPIKYIHPLTSLVAFVIYATDVAHLALTREATLTVNVILVLIGAASFFLSLRWFLLTCAAIVASWTALSLVWVGLSWIPFGIAMGVTLLLSTIIQMSRLRAFGELELFGLRVKRLSDATFEGIVILKDMTIQDINKSLEHTFGYAPADLAGKPFGYLFAGDAPDSPAGEAMAKGKDERVFPVEFASQLITDGKEPMVAVAIRDISEKKRAEEIIEGQRKRMIYGAKMSALGEMAGGIAHEINNPLSAIVLQNGMLVRLLERAEIDKKTFKASIEQVSSAAQRIKKIITGLITFARDAEKDDFEVASLRMIIDETLFFASEKFRRNHIHLHVDSIPENLFLECKPTQLSQILVNLLGNAFDAVMETADRWVRISCADSGDWVEISVTDSGHGVPEEIRDKIFHPFFTTKGPDRGTGLGLSIANGLAEVHHGTLELDPASEHTRFVLRIPKVQPETRRAQSAAS